MSKSAELAALVQSRAGSEAPRLGLILGSGLGHLAEEVNGVAIPYADLPGFPHAGVSGHNPKLVIGTLEGVRVAVFGGRVHYYEHGNPAEMRLPLELLKALGCESLLLTNAAGSLRPDIPPGDLMLLSDHIAFAGTNPLIGEPTDARFVPMTDAHDAEMRAGLSAAAEAEGVALSRLVFEITESHVIDGTGVVHHTIHELADAGAGISIDDFGTGYSSMVNLRSLPISELKVDKTFVQGMRTNPNDAAIVRSVVDLGHSLGLSVTAEGVEEVETLGLLRNLGCDVSQGFLHARPVALDELVDMVCSGEATPTVRR